MKNKGYLRDHCSRVNWAFHELLPFSADAVRSEILNTSLILSQSKDWPGLPQFPMLVTIFAVWKHTKRCVSVVIGSGRRGTLRENEAVGLGRAAHFSASLCFTLRTGVVDCSRFRSPFPIIEPNSSGFLPRFVTDIPKG